MRVARQTLAHVGMAGGQPDLHATRDRDHRRPTSLASVLMIAETIAGSVAPAIRIRAPLANSTSIMLDTAASGTTATGANPGEKQRIVAAAIEPGAVAFSMGACSLRNLRQIDIDVL